MILQSVMIFGNVIVVNVCPFGRFVVVLRNMQFPLNPRTWLVVHLFPLFASNYITTSYHSKSRSGGFLLSTSPRLCFFGFYFKLLDTIRLVIVCLLCSKMAW